MKKTLFCLLSAALSLCFSVSAAASDIPADEPAEGDDPLLSVYQESSPAPGVTKFVDNDDYIVDGKVVVKRDTVIPEGVSLYIRDGGSLIIKKGATVTALGKIVLERGGKLYVTDGTLNMSGVFHNYGKLIIRKDGVFRSSFSYSGNAGSRIVLEGEAYFGKLALSDAVREIRKLDPKFRLKNYCITAYDYGARTPTGGQIYFYYRIGNVRTDYYYKAGTDADKPTFERKEIALETVYDEALGERIAEAAEKHFSENIGELSDPAYNLFSINTTYDYSYEKGRLGYEWTWFEYNLEDEMWMEKLKDGRVKLRK
ncbi:MAG: hypothetical protein NC084_11270 [Bacteroides sp.]|nr:hypothetical protein [Eubacterium sp.]MCM1419505.1 hypothetical protein [Roseburia sp.]MCM1463270.1 hypothetical protein [Bacteroides sp.]